MENRSKDGLEETEEKNLCTPLDQAKSLIIVGVELRVRGREDIGEIFRKQTSTHPSSELVTVLRTSEQTEHSWKAQNTIQ